VFKAPVSPAGDGSESGKKQSGVGPQMFWWAALRCVRKAVIKREHSLRSKKVGVLRPGQAVQVTAVRDVQGSERVQCSLGWLSLTSSSGNTLLVPVEGSKPRPVAAAPRLTVAEKWALEEKQQRDEIIAKLKLELGAMGLEQLQRRALEEGVGTASLLAALEGQGWEKSTTPKQAITALLIAAEEAKLDAPIVSSYRGVWWSRNSHKWQAAIQYNNVKEMLGCFPTEESAARAYDEVARREHQEKARLNFPLAGEIQGHKLRSLTEEELRQRQEKRLAKKQEERGHEEEHVKRIVALKTELKRLPLEQLKGRALVEGLFPARVDAAIDKGTAAKGAKGARRALILLIVAVEDAREDVRRADRRAQSLAKAAELRAAKKANRTSIIVRVHPDDDDGGGGGGGGSPDVHSKAARWTLMPSDVSAARRRAVAAFSADEERERAAAVAALREREERRRLAEAERLERGRLARRASLPSADRRNLLRDEAKMRSMLAPAALEGCSGEHVGQISRLMKFFEEFHVTSPELIERARGAVQHHSSVEAAEARCRRLRAEAKADKKHGRIEAAKQKLSTMMEEQRHITEAKTKTSRLGSAAAAKTETQAPEADGVLIAAGEPPPAAAAAAAAAATTATTAAAAPPVEWIQCEEPTCRKWRKLMPGMTASSLNIAVFTCARNHWSPQHASCDAPQEKPDSALLAAAKRARATSAA
jgi:hypothetical protein